MKRTLTIILGLLLIATLIMATSAAAEPQNESQVTAANSSNAGQGHFANVDPLPRPGKINATKENTVFLRGRNNLYYGSRDLMVGDFLQLPNGSFVWEVTIYLNAEEARNSGKSDSGWYSALFDMQEDVHYVRLNVESGNVIVYGKTSLQSQTGLKENFMFSPSPNILEQIAIMETNLPLEFKPPVEEVPVG